MILVSEQTVMGYSNLMAVLIIMHSSEKSFSAISHFMAMLIIMIGVCSQKALAAVSDLMAAFIVMIRPIWQNALMAKDLFHAFLRFMNES